MYFISHIFVWLCEYRCTDICCIFFENFEKSCIHSYRGTCLCLTNSKKEDFHFSIHRGLSLTCSFCFAKGLACKMEHHHHFSSYFTVCLPDWDRILLLYLATFSSSLAFGDFSKGLFGLVLSGTTTSHFNLFCGCLCCLSISWPKFFLRFKSWARGSALELVSFAVSEVSFDVRTRQLL